MEEPAEVPTSVDPRSSREQAPTEQIPLRLKPPRPRGHAEGFLWVFVGLIVLGVGLSIYAGFLRRAPSLKPVLLRANEVSGFVLLGTYTGRGRGMAFGHQEWESRQHDLLLNLRYTATSREENVRRSLPRWVGRLEAEDGYHPVGPKIHSPHSDRIRMVGPYGPALVVRQGHFRIELEAIREEPGDRASQWRDEKLSQVLDGAAEIILRRCR
jgi:hypothetical protein